MIQKKHLLARKRRCELLKVARSSSYYPPQPVPEKGQVLMRLIDRIHLEKPYLGSRRIVNALTEHGNKTDRKCVQRLMRLKGKQSLVKYFRFYNKNRKHQTLKATPDQVYYESIKLPETG